MVSSWQVTAASSQARVLDSIPGKWKLSSKIDKTVTDVSLIPTLCGILSPAQIQITESTATNLLQRLHSGSLTSVEVTEAFLARAAIAHQLVSLSLCKKCGHGTNCRF